MNLGIKIKTLRNQKGTTQNELARHLNVTRQAVSNWERNKAEPDAEMIKDIADFFKIEVNYLFYDGLPVTINRTTLKTLFLINTVFFMIHLVGLFLQLNYIITFITVPGLIFFMLFILRTVFSRSIKNKDYSMIAGYNKEKDSDRKTEKQLYYIEFYVQIMSMLCNVLFFATYCVNTEKVMFVSLLLVMIFVSVVAVISLIVNKKVG